MSSVRRILTAILSGAAALALIVACSSPEPTATATRPPAFPTRAASPTAVVKSYSGYPPMTISTDKRYFANMETEAGMIRLELFPKKAPLTVNSFVFLARDGFYDGIIFHRVIPGFMAQGGDPTGTGTSGPGYSFKDEFSDLTHNVGAISMANSGPNTNGSQFFIVYEPAHHLDGKHSVFGQVVAGMDVALKITPRPDGRTGPTTRILNISIEEA